jgi:hypothetical protein
MKCRERGSLKIGIAPGPVRGEPLERSRFNVI